MTINLAFQSTSPVRGTTANSISITLCSLISIHVPREGDDGNVYKYKVGSSAISIHVPREGDDHSARARENYRKNFNPRPP